MKLVPTKSIGCLCLFLILSLYCTHVNIVERIIGEDTWLDFCMMRSMSQQYMDITGQISFDEDLKMTISGIRKENELLLTLKEGHVGLADIIVNLDSGELSIHSLMGAIEGLDIGTLFEDILQEDLSQASHICVLERHHMIDDNITDVYLLNEYLEISVDYTGLIRQIKLRSNVSEMGYIKISY